MKTVVEVSLLLLLGSGGGSGSVCQGAEEGLRKKGRKQCIVDVQIRGSGKACCVGTFDLDVPYHGGSNNHC